MEMEEINYLYLYVFRSLLLSVNCHQSVLQMYCISVAVRCRAGVDVNIVNLQGRSPLRIALLEGNLDLAGLLLDNGANIDYLDNDSRLETETFLLLHLWCANVTTIRGLLTFHPRIFT